MKFCREIGVFYGGMNGKRGKRGSGFPSLGVVFTSEKCGSGHTMLIPWKEAEWQKLSIVAIIGIVCLFSLI
jgi:hypothetical protein